MLCAARARVGGVPVTWWAVWDGERLHERTQRRAGARADDAAARVRRVARSTSLRGGRRASRSSRPTARSTSGRASRRGMPVRGAVLGRAVRGLRLHRRHGRLPRAPHRLALVGRGRDRRVRRARRVEPRRRRARRAASARSAPSGSTARRTTSSRRAFAGDLSRGRRPALRGRSGPRPPRADARLRLRLRAAVRTLHGSLPHAGNLREGLGCIRTPRRPVVTCASRHKEALDASLPADPAAPPPDGSRRRPRGRVRHDGAVVHARGPARR